MHGNKAQDITPTVIMDLLEEDELVAPAPVQVHSVIAQVRSSHYILIYISSRLCPCRLTHLLLSFNHALLSYMFHTYNQSHITFIITLTRTKYSDHVSVDSCIIFTHSSIFHRL